MRKYKEHSDILFNESIFSIFGGKKDKQETKRKAIKGSDVEMIELIEEIEKTFDIKNLKSEKPSLTKYFHYKLNDVDIEISNYSGDFGLKINKNRIVTDLISDDLLQELWDFFINEEKNRDIRMNTEYFGKALSSRRNADKYNL